jgi:hypothetical protein
MALSDLGVDGTIGESWFSAGGASRVAEGPLQSHVRWVTGVPSQVHNADHLLVVPYLRISGALPPLICIHDAVLNEGHTISPNPTSPLCRLAILSTQWLVLFFAIDTRPDDLGRRGMWSGEKGRAVIATVFSLFFHLLLGL